MQRVLSMFAILLCTSVALAGTPAGPATRWLRYPSPHCENDQGAWVSNGCAALSVNTDRIMPKQCLRQWGCVANRDDLRTPNDLDPVCCHIEKWSTGR
jgi:hypothetical protein